MSKLQLMFRLEALKNVTRKEVDVTKRRSLDISVEEIHRSVTMMRRGEINKLRCRPTMHGVDESC